MKNVESRKKGKGPKKAKKRGATSTDEDVVVNTGLPPKVEGQLRCYLKLSVNQILWLVANPPDVTHVRVQWWGEDSEGALFRPVDVKRGEKEISRTVAKYAIRSGPKQFAAYLNDMSSLVFEVLSGPMMVIVGRAQIEQIGTLSPSKPINGFFPVFSADSEKIAELQVSAILESIMASFDSTSSTPTVDMSSELYARNRESHPINPSRAVPAPFPAPRVVHSSAEDPFTSPAVPRSAKQAPRGIDQQMYKGHNPLRDSIQSNASMASSSTHPRSSSNQAESTVYPQSTIGNTRGGGNKRNMGNTASTLNGIQSIDSELSGLEGVVVKGHAVKHYSGKGGLRTCEQESSASGQNDVVSALLERGSKLKEAMIISTLDQPKSTDDTSSVDMQRDGSTGNLFNDTLSDDPMKARHRQDPALVGHSIDFAETEDRMVDLVVGLGITNSEFQLLKANGASPRSSISADDVPSDIGDPLHDDSILQELFYKEHSEDSELYLSDAEESRTSLLRHKKHNASLEDVGNRRPPSRTSSRCSSLSSLEREPVRDSGPKGTPTKKKSSKKGKKKKRRGSRSDASESDTGSVSRMSESSRVSFDPAPSDAEETPLVYGAGRDAPVDGMSVQRLTLLGRVHVARVVVDYLQLVADALEESFSSVSSRGRPKLKARGRPPRPSPKAKKAVTYFVEYQFPVVATSRDKYQPNAMATEVMRVASKKVLNGVVTFGHRSVFPVLFDGESIEKWWKSGLIFKVYSKSSGQKVPRLIGMCSVPLKSVLKSEALFLEKSMDVKDRSAGSAKSGTRKKKTTDWPVVGDLRVTIELASDSRDFSTALAKTRLAEMTNPKIVPIPPPAPVAKLSPTKSKPGRAVTSETQTEPRTADIDEMPLAVPDLPPSSSHIPPPLPPLPRTVQNRRPSPIRTAQQSGNYQQDQNFEALTLHTLLMVPGGYDITPNGTLPTRHGDKSPSSPPKPLTGWTGRDMATRNLYLVCRMFWCDDVSRSNVVWGSFDPDFKFVQVAPVLLTASLLERMRNNVMVIEVWDKKTSSENDCLVGIVKLPIHQFYMSFRDRKIANSLLRSQYPVVAVDDDLPIVNPFSGAQFGKIKVLLAIGSGEQVTVLQRLKLDQGAAASLPGERPSHYLERQHLFPDGRGAQDYGAINNILEHTFEVSIEGIKGLQLLDTMTWGEADCFIQYHFPVQTHTTQYGGNKILNATPSLKTFRTATTLCVPDPMFNDVLRHKISLPEGTPVQREILGACAGVGGGVGGIPFEVWCRYYHPNVRDQVIAKSTLPLAKLCAMVTMQKRGGPNVQSFTLPLSSLVPEAERGETSSTPMPETGLLEVTINYRTSILKGESTTPSEAVSKSLPGPIACVSVGVIRASGLQAAAITLARHDLGLQYASEVGVNSYIRTKLSFLPKEDERITRTVARTFSPEFGFYIDFPCPLLWTEPGADVISLAELLENAEATFELWHQCPSTLDTERHHMYTGTSDVTGRRTVSLTGDILLGTATVPLLSLLTRKTGIAGWFPINLPSIGWGTSASDQSEEGHNGNRGLERVVGGVEIQVKFAHSEDLERILHAARGVGWSPDIDVEHRDWESGDDSTNMFHQMTVAVDLGCFPAVNTLLPGQTSLDLSTRCYVRYKLYSKDAVCSKMCEVEENDDGYLIADLQHSKTVVIPGSAPFLWYLREERLEVQVWISHAGEAEETKRPRNRDKLIGTAQLDLAPLADTRRRQHRVSGVYPLFKPGSSNLGGACVRAHVTTRPNAGGWVESDEESEEVVTPRRSSPSRGRMSSPHRKHSYRQHSSDDPENTFAAHICVERALHLPPVYEKGITGAPSSYVSYQTSESAELTCTTIFPKAADPVWDHEHNTRLDRQLLVAGSRNLVFKVWHRSPELQLQPDPSADRVLGFVSVDLAPLTTGFLHICGWYNIMDFSGQCQGQIKVAVTPQESLYGLKSSDGTSGIDVATGFASYMTSGAYTQFPSHVSWYPEQRITMDTGSTVPSGTQGEAGGGQESGPEQPQHPHFSEHYANVKKYHIKLNQRMSEMGVTDPNTASRSILFHNLRTNMQDLDDITSKLKQKLYGSEPGPSISRSDQQANGNPPSLSAAIHLSQQVTLPEAVSTGETEFSTHRTTDDTSGKLPASTTFILGSDSAFHGSTTESRAAAAAGERAAAAGGYTPHTTGDSIPNSVLDSTHHFTPREAGRDLDELLTTGDSRKTDKTTDKSANTESDYARVLERAQVLLQAISGDDTPSPFTPRDPVTPRERHPHFKEASTDSQGSTLKSSDQPDGLLQRIDAARQAEDGDGGDSIIDFDEGGDEPFPGSVAHSRIHAEDDSELLDHDDTYANIWAQRDEQLASDDLSDAEATIVQPRALNDVSSANFANAVDTDTFGRVTPISNTLGASDTYFELTQTAPFSGRDFKFSSAGSRSEQIDDMLTTAPKPADRLDFVMDENLAISGENGEESAGSSQRLLEERDAALAVEDPTVFKPVSRTSLSDRQAQGKGKSARRAAMYRREYEHHRHGGASSSEEESCSRERQRSGSRSRRNGHRSRSQSSQGSHTQNRDTPTVDTNPPPPQQQLTHEERVAHQAAMSPEGDSDADLHHGEPPAAESGSAATGSVSTVRDGGERATDSDPPGDVGHIAGDDDKGQDDHLPENESNNSSRGFALPSGSEASEADAVEEDEEEPRSGGGEHAELFAPPSHVTRAMRTGHSALPNGHLHPEHVDCEDVRSEASSKGSAGEYTKLAFNISAKNIPKPNAEQSKRIAKIFAQKFSKDKK